MDGARRMVATNLGAVLADQGRRHGWLAGRIGVSPSLVTLVLKGERTLSREAAERAAAALGVPVLVVFAEAGDTVREAEIA